jgi:hypothetical protein
VVRVIRRGALVDRQVPGNRMVATRALHHPEGATPEDDVELLSLTVSLFADLDDGRRVTDEKSVTRSVVFVPPLVAVRQGEVREAEPDDWRSPAEDEVLRRVRDVLEDESRWERWSALAWPLLRAGAWSSIWRLGRLGKVLPCAKSRTRDRERKGYCAAGMSEENVEIDRSTSV